MAIKGIHHISMKCGTEEELAKVKEFYIDLLGMKIIRQWPEGLMIDTGNGCIEIFTNAPGERQLGAIRHIALLTDDVDGCARKVKEAVLCSDDADPSPVRQGNDEVRHNYTRNSLLEVAEVEFFCER